MDHYRADHLCCYRPQRSWRKVIFSQASVILSTGGGRAWLGGRHAWLGVRAWLGGMHGTHAPPRQILWLRHTVNERAVRILLECILVCLLFVLLDAQVRTTLSVFIGIIDDQARNTVLLTCIVCLLLVVLKLIQNGVYLIVSHAVTFVLVMFRHSQISPQRSKTQIKKDSICYCYLQRDCYFTD